MSMGYDVSARIVLKDEKRVVYEYSPYNLNEPQYRNSKHIYDGLITISTDSMVKPEIHTKLKHMPRGRKQLIVKRIRRDIDYSALIAAGAIVIKNSRYCWRFVESKKEIGMMAMQIIFHIYSHNQEEGTLPETVSLNY